MECLMVKNSLIILSHMLRIKHLTIILPHMLTTSFHMCIICSVTFTIYALKSTIVIHFLTLISLSAMLIMQHHISRV